ASIDSSEIIVDVHRKQIRGPKRVIDLRVDAKRHGAVEGRCTAQKRREVNQNTVIVEWQQRNRVDHLVAGIDRDWCGSVRATGTGTGEINRRWRAKAAIAEVHPCQEAIGRLRTYSENSIGSQQSRSVLVHRASI